MITTPIGTRIAAARIAKGYSQSQLAALIGAHKNTIYRAEKTGSINTDTLCAIAKVLGVSAGSLVDRK